MKIMFEITLDDWLAFQKHHYIQLSQSNRRKFVRILPPLFFLFHGISNFFAGVFINAMTDVVVGLLLFFLEPIVTEKFHMRYAKKMLEDDDNQGALGTNIVEFFDEYLFVKDPVSESKIDWSKIIRVDENEDYVFIYITSVSAHIIPQSAIGDKKNEIMGFIKNKVG